MDDIYIVNNMFSQQHFTEIVEKNKVVFQIQTLQQNLLRAMLNVSFELIGEQNYRELFINLIKWI